MMVDELRIKVDELRSAMAELKTQAALTEQHVLHHERTVNAALADQRSRTNTLEQKIDDGFERLHAANDKQTEILGEQKDAMNLQKETIDKWGTIRDTLFWVAGILGIAVAAVWAVFVWLTGEFWHK